MIIGDLWLPHYRGASLIKHVLVIEDDYFLAIDMRQALIALGFNGIDLSASVEQAKICAKRQCPNLIVADYRIVGGTGVEAVLAICSDIAIPVVFVTGNGAEVRQLMPTAIIVGKPWIARELEQAIKMAIERPFQGSES